jgi:SAM-dependent methyltransferase
VTGHEATRAAAEGPGGDEWENAEVARSAVEAREAEEAGLRLEDASITRYLHSPEDTEFALEYAFFLLGDIRGRTVLDFGCGSGKCAVALRARGARLIALDISPHLLEVARKRLEVHALTGDTEFVLASGHEMPIPDASVDVVFGSAILHHLDLRHAAAEVHRVLRPGGYAVFKEPVRDSRLFVLLRRLFPNRSEDISPFEYPLSRSQLRTFREPFIAGPSRRFDLPGTVLLKKLSGSAGLKQLSRRFDRGTLRVMPFLGAWAGVEVFQVRKRADGR